MKYVILEPRPGVKALTRILACCAPTLHEELAKPFEATHAPVAAGFFEFTAPGVVRVFGFSNSLQLGPRPVDAAILAAMSRGTVAMAPDRPAAA